MSSLEAIKKILANYPDPYLQDHFLEGVKLKLEENTLQVCLGFPCEREKPRLTRDLLAYLKSHGCNVHVDITWKVRAHQVQPSMPAVPGVKNIIAIASGKGGVGKSTTTVNLALALKAQGAKVGLLDADIYGPNQPEMLGVTEKPEIVDKKFKPLEAYGMPTMSIGYIIDAQQPTIWRGPMVSGALQQMLNDTQWPELDYLLIDMPPGTGDIQLTLAQKVPVSGAVIVTTPQNVAVQDARKGLAMFRKVNIDVLGVIENMSYYECPQCYYHDHLFGERGGENMAEQFNVRFLGAVPLNVMIRQQGDKGKPIVQSDEGGSIAKIYHQAALNMASSLSLRKRNYAAKFPRVNVESTDPS